MVKAIRYLLPLTIVLCAQHGWANPAGAPPPSPAPGVSGGSGGGAQAGTSGDAALWSRLRRVQKTIPTDARRELPFAGVQVVDGRFKAPSLVIRHNDETSSAFQAVGAVYRLDGYELATLRGADEASRSNLEVFRGRVISGRHTLDVLMRVKGRGYGIFTYMKRYRVTLNTSRDFDVGRSGTTQLFVRLKERGTTDLQRRFAIDVQIRGGRVVKAKPPRLGAIRTQAAQTK